MSCFCLIIPFNLTITLRQLRIILLSHVRRDRASKIHKKIEVPYSSYQLSHEFNRCLNPLAHKLMLTQFTKCVGFLGWTYRWKHKSQCCWFFGRKSPCLNTNSLCLGSLHSHKRGFKQGKAEMRLFASASVFAFCGTAYNQLGRSLSRVGNLFSHIQLLSFPQDKRTKPGFPRGSIKREQSDMTSAMVKVSLVLPWKI